MALLPPDPVFCLKSPELAAYHSLCFHTSEHLYAGTAKGTVHLWELQTNRTSYQLSVGSSPIVNLAHTEDALITQEKDGSVKLWELANADYVLRHDVPTEHIGFCRFAYDAQADTVIVPRTGATIASLSGKTFVETAQYTPTADDEAATKFGCVMCFQPIELQQGQRYLLAGYESGVLALWDPRTARILSHVRFGTDATDCLLSVDYDPVTNRGIAAGSCDKLFIFSLDRKTLEVRPKSEIAVKNGGIHRLRIRKDLKVFTSGGWDGRIRIFSWKSLRPLAVLTEHKGELLDIAYSPGKVSMWKASIMAAAGSDGQISLWDLYN